MTHVSQFALMGRPLATCGQVFLFSHLWGHSAKSESGRIPQLDACNRQSGWKLFALQVLTILYRGRLKPGGSEFELKPPRSAQFTPPEASRVGFAFRVYQYLRLHPMPTSMRCVR